MCIRVGPAPRQAEDEAGAKVPLRTGSSQLESKSNEQIKHTKPSQQ